MNRTVLAGCFLAGALVVGGEARAQDYGQGPRTYYLHSPSSYQQGCWGPCTCPLSNTERMRGSFTLGLITVGNATDFYSVTNVDWRVPTLGGQAFNESLTGSGTFAAGQVPFASHQSMSLDLVMSPVLAPWAAAQHFDTTAAAYMRTVSPPVIDIEVANSTLGCPGIRLRVAASWYRSDWNGNGAVSVQDLFDFLADYFQGRGDYNGDGVTSVQDIFDFLADWFAGV